MSDPMLVMAVGFAAGSVIEAVRSMIVRPTAAQLPEDTKEFENYVG